MSELFSYLNNSLTANITGFSSAIAQRHGDFQYLFVSTQNLKDETQLMVFRKYIGKNGF
jgi:hypothetical protein